MLNSKGQRELCYLVKVDGIKELPGYDRVETAIVGGWKCIVPKGQFHEGSLGIYFEIDSLVDAGNPVFNFMEKRNYKVKTQKMCKSISQGLLMSPADFGWAVGLDENGEEIDVGTDTGVYRVDDETRFLTDVLKVTYAVAEDNVRKGKNQPDKYKKMASRNAKLFKHYPFRWLMRRDWGKKFLYFFFKNKGKATNDKGWPTGIFPGVSKTDQERCENMPWVLQDKTPFIVTQKCDGSSGTYILQRKPKGKFEFYVCSRNVRMLDENQESFYGSHNYYWEVAKKYNIEEKMGLYLAGHPDVDFVCWQGEICSPGIQGNPHNLKETHFYCFHWTDNVNGRLDIREAKKLWDAAQMETVPIVCDNYIMPNDFEEFKLSADGFYDPICCEGDKNRRREGFVYYKTDDPTFSFKNVSREYLLKHHH